jgi:glutamate dehydrogenase
MRDDNTASKGMIIPPNTQNGDLPSPSCEYQGKAPITDGYLQNTFVGKEEQVSAVARLLKEQGFIPDTLAMAEVDWFYDNLGIDDLYFQRESVDTIAKHITALYAAKVQCYAKQCDTLNINLEQEFSDRALFIHNSQPGVSNLQGPCYEQRIDTHYLSDASPQQAFRLETYRSSGTVSEAHKTQLRCYFVTQCDFVEPTPSPEDRFDISKVGDKTFLAKATKSTLVLYSNVLRKVLSGYGPVIEATDSPSQDMHLKIKRVVIGYRQGTCHNFFSSLSHLYHYYGLYSTRKYVENFSNGVCIISLYLAPLSNTRFPPIEHSVLQIIKEASLIYCLPASPLQDFFATGSLSVQETIYGYSAMAFAQHFLNRLGSEYMALSNLLDQNNAAHLDVLLRLKKRLRRETYTRAYILEIVRAYPIIIHGLYVDFAVRLHHLIPEVPQRDPSLSYQRLVREKALTEKELMELIIKTVANPTEATVFEAFLSFNKHVLRTNFYEPSKVALAYRLNPSFLPQAEYPQQPFGLFLVIGSEFRGFHVRFRDVARGGIRIIKSRNRETYSINLRGLFDENYSLAATQDRKNKDIPEGGSKGTILLDADQQDKVAMAFKKYVDSILDLLLSTQDTDNKEILFFGPDEGTADLMDWASQHAQQRGAAFWNAFTTGKSPSLGGIPHDTYGMTTRGIHTYVQGIYEKFNLCQSDVTKMQTGGPDGDLGSNEIKISSDRTIAIVDGSGVLYDPKGIDRLELQRLAELRQPISSFDASKLGPQGFRILVDDVNVTLPNGRIVESGLRFRNEFHLDDLASAVLFVPCGGRPESIDLDNVDRLYSAKGEAKFRFIVEGANLFLTQEARLHLEKNGVIIFKDASANKGGVTSSSLEVMAALALNDDEFGRHMMRKESDFYDRYVQQVQRCIEENARLEFECLWREGERMQQPRSILSDSLSLAIRKLNEELSGPEADSIFLDKADAVLSKAVPSLLLNLIGGVGEFRKRMPVNYQHALFASYLASRFVYAYGLQAGQFSFHQFMSQI